MSRVEISGFLDDEAAQQVARLVADAAAEDGSQAVSEHFVLRLDDRADTGRVRHATAHDDSGDVVGYAVADRGDTPGAELVVAPMSRRAGTATALLAALRRDAGVPLHVWAHGDLPAARAFATRVDAREIRRLLELRRPAAPVDVPEPAPGVTVRTFRPGADDAAWLTVNAAAFAAHPEQGAWTQHDLDERKAEAWFDPAGFFLAERDGEVVAFHWTKRHSADLGEVYVVGVSPEAQGLGLGRLMTATGLAHLHAAGVAEVSLFVDEGNAAAVALYRDLGFLDHHADSQWLVA